MNLTVEPMTSFLGGEMNLSLQRPNGTIDRLAVRIPPGAKHGGKLRLPGQGLPPVGGGPCGDLYLTLSIPEHPLLQRDGDDLEMDVPLTVLEAIQGTRITVPTPTGNVKVTIPAGVEPGQRLRLKGRGVQRPGKLGNLYLVLRPTVPHTKSPEIIAAAEAIESAYEGDIRSKLTL